MLNEPTVEKLKAMRLDALAAALVARETLNEQEVLEVTGLAPAPPRSVLWLRELNKVIRIARG